MHLPGTFAGLLIPLSLLVGFCHGNGPKDNPDNLTWVYPEKDWQGQIYHLVPDTTCWHLEMKHFKSAEVREPVTCKFYRDRDCAKDLIKEVGAPGVKDFDALFAGTKVPTDIWVKCAVKKP
ncbi:hypothetical protein FQN52_006699 [Onygenales sp. PD_12]|nr:hypothetical protein FQN52_006699 [Onygenales sp. PD_12]